MNGTETLELRAARAEDAAVRGRILVVDDDRVFGGFMLAALESRGHDVDWAGCIADAIATLYARRYDLLIVDLRLPDGSGLELLRQATEEGVAGDASTIILTGHDFDEPDDMRVFHKSVDIETFLDRTSDVLLTARRRRAQAKSQADAVARDDTRRTRKRGKIDLVLYTSAQSEKCQRAIRAIREVLDRYDLSQVAFRICDLAGRPSRGDEDSIVFTPTLVKRSPGPRTWIVGNLEHSELLVDLLEMSGVERRRDGW